MTAPSLTASPQLAGEDCARCHEAMVLTPDALGRLRKRCPRCDGIAHRVTVHPDDARVPQTLVRVGELLPAVEPGQLRCQRCAKGVEGDRRFCVRCQPGAFAPKPCKAPSCRDWFTPSGPNAQYCEAHR